MFVNTLIGITPQQLEALATLGGREKVSRAELVRRAIDMLLESRRAPAKKPASKKTVGKKTAVKPAKKEPKPAVSGQSGGPDAFGYY